MKVENLYRPIFNSFDADRSGFIDVQDVLTIMEGKGYKAAEVQRFIARNDMDKDGKLSYDEFLKYFFALRKK